MKTWFTADMHFGHKNIIKYCDRPFKDVNHMNAELIKRWNEVVSANDQIIHVGDFASSYEKVDIDRILDQLNGNIVFVRGNHDDNLKIRVEELVFRLGKKACHVVHNPIDALLDYNLVGHIHKQWRSKIIDGKKLVNVGVDVWDFRPVSLAKINKEFGLLEVK